MWCGLNGFDWGILAAYLLGLTAVGVWGGRRVRAVGEYCLGPRRFGRGVLTLFVLGSSTSAGQVAGSVGTIFRVGLGGFWYQLIHLFTVPFHWLVAPLIWRTRAVTMADFFEVRFGRAAGTLYAGFGVAMGVFLLGSGLGAGGAAISALTGGELPAGPALAAVTLLFILYVSLAGMRGAIVTNAVQGVMTIIASVVLLPFIFARIGGFAGLHQGAAGLAGARPGLVDLAWRPRIAELLGRAPLTPFYLVMVTLVGLIGIAVQPLTIVSCTPARTEWDARFAGTVGNLLKRLCSVAWAFTGLACAVLYLTPGMLATFAAKPEAEKAYAAEVFGVAAHGLLRPAGFGLVGLLLAALLGMALSTAAAQLAVTNALWINNVYQRRLRPGRDDAHYLLVARLSGAVIVGVAAVLGLGFEKGMWGLEILISAPIGIGVSFWLGLFWRRFNGAGMIAATITGWATWVFLEWQGGARLVQRAWPAIVTVINDKLEVNDAWIMLAYLTTSVAAGVGVSLLTRPDSAERLDHFFAQTRGPAEVGKLRVWAGFAAAWVGVAAIITLTWWLSRRR